MLRLAAERDELSVVADQWGAPTSAALLADITAHLVRQHALGLDSDSRPRGGHVAAAGVYPDDRPVEKFPFGSYHVAAAGVTNWHEYACHVIERARLAGRTIRVEPDKIRAITSAQFPTPARRPANSRLSTEKLRSTFGLHLPSWQDGVDHVLDQIL